MREPSSRGDRAVRIIVLGVAIGAAYVFTLTFRQTSDTRLNSLQTRALVTHGDIDLTRYHPDLGFRVSHGPDTYSVYGIGISIVAAPFYLPLTRAGVNEATLQGTVALFYGVVAVLCLYMLLSRLFSRRVAIGGAILFGFGTSMWTLGVTALWQQAPVALFFCLGLLALFDDSARAPYAAGFCFGMATLVRLPMLITLPIVGAYYLIEGKRPTVRYLLAAAVPLFAIAVQNRWIWGNWLHSSYQSAPSTFSGSQFAHTVRWESIGWLRGLFVYSPALILAVFGMVEVARAIGTRLGRRLAVAALSSLAFFLLYAFWGPDSGSRQYGYRYLLDATPFLVLLVAFAAERIRALRWPALILTTMSVFVFAMGSSPNARSWDPLPQRPGFHLSPLGRALTGFLHDPTQTLLRLAIVAAVAFILGRVSPREASTSLAPQTRT